MNPPSKKLSSTNMILQEGFNEKKNTKEIPYRCPNVLVQKGSDYYLFNTKITNH